MEFDLPSAGSHQQQHQALVLSPSDPRSQRGSGTISFYLPLLLTAYAYM